MGLISGLRSSCTPKSFVIGETLSGQLLLLSSTRSWDPSVPPWQFTVSNTKKFLNVDKRPSCGSKVVARPSWLRSEIAHRRAAMRDGSGRPGGMKPVKSIEVRNEDPIYVLLPAAPLSRNPLIHLVHDPSRLLPLNTGIS